MSLFDENDEKYDEIYNKALSLLDYSLNTEKMLYDKLIKKGYGKESVKKVLKKLKSLEILNDKEYAAVYADNLVKYKYCWINLILSKLKQKGIDDELSKTIVEGIEQNYNETEIAENFIRKNKYSVKRYLEKDQSDKIKLKLLNNGFNFNVINNILKNINLIIEGE